MNIESVRVGVFPVGVEVDDPAATELPIRITAFGRYIHVAVVVVQLMIILESQAMGDRGRSMVDRLIVVIFCISIITVSVLNNSMAIVARADTRIW